MLVKGRYHFSPLPNWQRSIYPYSDKEVVREYSCSLLVGIQIGKNHCGGQFGKIYQGFMHPTPGFKKQATQPCFKLWLVHRKQLKNKIYFRQLPTDAHRLFRLLLCSFQLWLATESQPQTPASLSRALGLLGQTLQTSLVFRLHLTSHPSLSPNVLVSQCLFQSQDEVRSNHCHHLILHGLPRPADWLLHHSSSSFSCWSRIFEQSSLKIQSWLFFAKCKS